MNSHFHISASQKRLGDEAGRKGGGLTAGGSGLSAEVLTGSVLMALESMKARTTA